MKKKFFISIIVASLLVCLFAISISAATYGESNIYYFDSSVEDLTTKQTSDAMFISTRDANDVITSYSGSFPKTNANGDAISWYKTGQETVDGNIYVAVSSFVTTDTNYATIHNDGRYIFASASGVSKQNIVSLNFPNDMGIKSFSNGSAYGLYAQTGSYTPANSELLFVYFPNTYQITDRAVQATPCLEAYFDPSCTFTTLADVAFYDCRSLRKVVLPTTITTINSNSGTFYSCKNLTEINITELTNLTTIGKQAFKECDSFVEITLPNSVTTIGERIFENCDNLVKVNFGANLSNLTQSLVYFSTKLQYIYLPNTITSSAGSHALTSSDSKTGYAQSVIFYNGTYDEALALKAIVIANGTSNNQKINHDNFIAWDSTKTDDYYIELATSEGKNYVVYGYNTCDAFYDGVHGESTTTYDFKDEIYTSEYCSYTGCARCNSTIENKEADALFVNKGYSTNTIDGVGITYTIVFNPTAIQKYEELANTIFEYGLVAATTKVVSDGALFDRAGTAVDANAIVTGFRGTDYTIYNLKITSIPTESQETGVYACAYVIDTNSAGVKTINYVGNTVATTAETVTYKAISEKNTQA